MLPVLCTDPPRDAQEAHSYDGSLDLDRVAVGAPPTDLLQSTIDVVTPRSLRRINGHILSGREEILFSALSSCQTSVREAVSCPHLELSPISEYSEADDPSFYSPEPADSPSPHLDHQPISFRLIDRNSGTVFQEVSQGTYGQLLYDKFFEGRCFEDTMPFVMPSFRNATAMSTQMDLQSDLHDMPSFALTLPTPQLDQSYESGSVMPPGPLDDTLGPSSLAEGLKRSTYGTGLFSGLRDEHQISSQPSLSADFLTPRSASASSRARADLGDLYPQDNGGFARWPSRSQDDRSCDRAKTWWKSTTRRLRDFMGTSFRTGDRRSSNAGQGCVSSRHRNTVSGRSSRGPATSILDDPRFPSVNPKDKPDIKRNPSTMAARSGSHQASIFPSTPRRWTKKGLRTPWKAPMPPKPPLLLPEDLTIQLCEALLWPSTTSGPGSVI